jgi:hypothetical protein
MRLACCAVVLASACGSTTDDRPATLANITESILKPSCASAECHSSFVKEKGYAFDTVVAARASFQGDQSIVDLDHLNTTEPPSLILNLTLDQASAPRMPYDAPIANADIDLIEKWLDLGLPGICVGDHACLGNELLACDSAGAYDLAKTTDATLCMNGCADGACK